MLWIMIADGDVIEFDFNLVMSKSTTKLSQR